MYDAKVVAEGGVEYARDVLEKAFGAQAATSLLERVTKSLSLKSFEFIRKADYKNLMAIIQNEHPQTIALILSYASAQQAATIIAELPKEKRLDVVERIATMDRTSPDVIKIVEQNLEKKFASIMSVDFMEFGGVNYIANIMNNMDRANEKYIFDELTRKDAQLCDEIRKRMFVFEDITIWTTCLFSVFCEKWIPRIWCLHSKEPTERFRMLFSKTCPIVRQRQYVPISNLRTMSGFETWKMHSNASLVSLGGLKMKAS